MDEAHADSKGFREIQALHPDWVPDFDSSYNFPPDSRMTVVAQPRDPQRHRRACRCCPPSSTGSPARDAAASDPRFAEVHDYLVEMTAAAGLNGRFVAEGDELVIAGPPGPVRGTKRALATEP